MAKKNKKGGEGAPGWIVTFADLMSLLLTFFILLLTFAEINAQKFKRALGSIKSAFGVQREYLYDNAMTSSNPMKRDFASGSEESVDKDFAPMQLAVQANEFCTLENQRRAKQKEDLEYLNAMLLQKIKDQPSLSQLIGVQLEEEGLRVRFKQSSLFYHGSAKMIRENMGLLKDFYQVLSNEVLKIQITNYSETLKASPEAFKKWKLSTDRSLVLAYVSRQIPSNSKHNIEVKSLPPQSQKREPASDQFIDFYINVEPKK